MCSITLSITQWFQQHQKVLHRGDELSVLYTLHEICNGVTWYKIQSQVIWLKILKAINYAGLINRSSKVFPGVGCLSQCKACVYIHSTLWMVSIIDVHKSIALGDNYVNYYVQNGNKIERKTVNALYTVSFWLSKYCYIV